MGAEVLERGEVQAIHALAGQGWAVKRISRELGLARNTVRAWLRRGVDWEPERMGRPPALSGEDQAWVRERFRAGVRNGDVLRQELAEQGLEVSLRTVERVVEDLREEAADTERATLRFETPPGRQMQIDFGEKWLRVAGERVKAFVFVATLGHSRRLFVQAHPAARQAHWLAGLEASLQHFGGVPQECLVDNARALVLRWAGDHPVFHPEFEAFCRHWGMKPRACRPYRARTKGKVESGVKYVKGNALGRLEFESWEALEGHLLCWMRDVADPREHGTTHERPIDRFEVERLALRPLTGQPPYRPVRREARKVASDAFVELDTNRYSVPCQLVGQPVTVEVADGRVRILWKGDVAAEHPVARGRHRQTLDPDHIASLVQRTYGDPQSIQRPLSVYAQVAGGEAW
jgi:transposase